jgi:hypothetical protein
MYTLKGLVSGSLFVFVLTATALAQESRAPIDTPREPVAAATAAPASVFRQASTPACIATEELKPEAERGTYLHPDLFTLKPTATTAMASGARSATAKRARSRR